MPPLWDLIAERGFLSARLLSVLSPLLSMVCPLVWIVPLSGVRAALGTDPLFVRVPGGQLDLCPFLVAGDRWQGIYWQSAGDAPPSLRAVSRIGFPVS